MTRILLPTQTMDVNLGFRFDEDLSGFQYSAPLDKLDREERKIYAELATENPPRELTPIVLSNGYVGIQGAKSFLPRNNYEIEHVYTEVFGRVLRYVDEDFQDILKRVKEIKNNDVG